MLIIGLYISISLSVLYVALEHFRFVRASYSGKNHSDKIYIHFMHGSYPKKDCIDQRKSVGGLLGGHIEIEIEGLVYGFEFGNRQKIHVFPRKTPRSFNSKCTVKQKADWLQETKYDRITTIVIPIDASKKRQLIDQFQSDHLQAPYDYAFFGMRCASYTYESMANAGIMTKKPGVAYILNAFYPRQLRKKMLRWAKYNGIGVEYKEGIGCRVWE